MEGMPEKLQMKLSERHRALLQESMDLLEITKKDAINRAIEGLHKIAMMQKKKENQA